MISPPDDCFAYSNYLEAEHRRLRQFVRSVQEAFAASLELSADQPGSRHRALIDRLSELHQQLDRHFEQEDQGGCIEEAVSRRPALASLARSLEAEQTQLLNELDQLIRHLGQRRASQDLAQVVDRFNEFAGTLRKHEAGESDLLQRGFNVNIEEA